MPGLFIQRHAATAASFADVSVIYLRAAPECKPGIELIDTLEYNCNTIRVYYGTNFNVAFLSVFARFFLFVKAFIKAYQYNQAKYGRPDLIHVNVLTRLGFFAFVTKLLYGIPYVITEHWSRYLPITGTFTGFFRKFLTCVVVKHADAVSTVSNNLAKAMQAHGLKNQNYRLLPNVVDFNKYTLGIKKNDSNSVRILHVSCFEDRSKNISGLLRVIQKVRLQRSDFYLIMVGEGIDLDLMKVYSNSLGIGDEVVTFKGLLENDELIKEYHQADFLIMFSNYENMPVVISEAFACGLPVLATSVGGIPEFVNSQNGLLVNSKDEDDLLAKCNMMIDTFSSFDPHSIRTEAASFFSEEAVGLALQKLYDINK